MRRMHRSVQSTATTGVGLTPMWPIHDCHPPMRHTVLQQQTPVTHDNTAVALLLPRSGQRAEGSTSLSTPPAGAHEMNHPHRGTCTQRAQSPGYNSKHAVLPQSAPVQQAASTLQQSSIAGACICRCLGRKICMCVLLHVVRCSHRTLLNSAAARACQRQVCPPLPPPPRPPATQHTQCKSVHPSAPTK